MTPLHDLLSIGWMWLVLVTELPDLLSAATQSTQDSLLADLIRVVSMRDYNTRVVIVGVATLGGAAGLVGSFTLLRKRALMGDALAHASTPGIAIAFIVATSLGGDGKSIPVLLAGASFTGLIGVAGILLIRNQTRLKEDAALGIVLSVFFGLGMALFGVIQQMQTGHAAGLEGFIFGMTASMQAADAQLIAAVSVIVIAGCLLLFKELQLLCFDEGFAGAQGYPVVVLDIILMAMIVLVTIVGLQAVGLILIIALLVIPAAAARFWTETMSRMIVCSAALGVTSSVIGGLASAMFPGLPSGAMIVLVCSVFFFVSMMLGTRRGVLIRLIRRRQLNRRIDRQHLLRAMYEQIERDQDAVDESLSHRKTPVSVAKLLSMRSWTLRRLERAIDRAVEDDLVRRSNGSCRLTGAGLTEAARLTRQHRLWEMYLITYAEVATANVDRDADAIEHVLAPEVIDQLEDLLDEQGTMIAVPVSPHDIAPEAEMENKTGGGEA
ncbi:iron chelate uptake ABC transporter family permease subunit [Rhodopirellula sp. MGV]|uniref:metal ABC transporter permease n=1 Tax=Rhodopirellula sp. MGV TaxID=2023130 RepID=UPI000B96186E|nr:iron chelate uptake ABC transporter family permease subunit [Rhodopirellula sp. MGV]OYP37378.1 iron ABC transporter [Rhodopirellula sp. MGV]PNY38037.1 iron ABC transporter [Rhodopirellula baltica]